MPTNLQDGVHTCRTQSLVISPGGLSDGGVFRIFSFSWRIWIGQWADRVNHGHGVPSRGKRFLG